MLSPELAQRVVMLMLMNRGGVGITSERWPTFLEIDYVTRHWLVDSWSVINHPTFCNLLIFIDKMIALIV